MNNRLMGTLLTFVAVVAGLSFATPSHASAKIVTDADATKLLKQQHRLALQKPMAALLLVKQV
jgi:hypothetical protein